jgi:hypothetical protein
MKTHPFRLLLNLLGLLTVGSPAFAATHYFFNPSQTATLVVSNINAVTIQSGDYRFS